MVLVSCLSICRIFIASMWVQQTRSLLPLSSRCSMLRPSRLFSTLDAETVKNQTSTPKRDLASFQKITLKRNRQSKAFRDGTQLVFSGSISKASNALQLADLVLVEVPVSNDNKNTNTQKIGIGVYNPHSMYRVRILCHFMLNAGLGLEKMEPVSALERILELQFHKALKTREAMGFPSSDTNTYRLVNGEGDGLSGLAIDVVGGNVAVLMSSAAWCEIHKTTIMTTLQSIMPNHELIWKTTPSRLKQDGYSIEEIDDNEGPEDVSPVIAIENGVKYRTFPHKKGQKTSVYCDQRENRLKLAELCKGKRVLDLCCYHGGFSLNAAIRGATRVVGVDSSEDAVDTCKENAKLNDVDDRVEFVKSDISAYMKSCIDKYDVIVLDPPKLAPSMATLNKARQKYHSLNRDALKLMDDEGGLFMTCTCSSAMTQKDGGKYFLQTIQQASLSAKREITLLRVSGAAPCHTQAPASFPAGNYLTAALFYVHPKQ